MALRNPHFKDQNWSQIRGGPVEREREEQRREEEEEEEEEKKRRRNQAKGMDSMIFVWNLVQI